MIEFDGKISGAAKKQMFKRGKQMGISILVMGLTIFFPFVILMWKDLESFSSFSIWQLPIAYIAVCIFLPLIAWVLPISKKDKDALTTCKVFVDKEYIVAILGNGSEEYKLISDAKKLNDYGDFYELVFSLRAGKSENFICQKNLLTKGTLNEFEALFEGKIVRITPKSKK